MNAVVGDLVAYGGRLLADVPFCLVGAMTILVVTGMAARVITVVQDAALSKRNA